MFRALATLADCISRNFRLWLLALAALMLVVLIMVYVLEPIIVGETGHRVFDIQTDASAGQIAAQVPLYTPRAHHAAWLFYAGDFAFPFLSGLLMSGLVAFGLRQIWPAAYASGRLAVLVLLPYSNSLADWLENVFALWLLGTYPPISNIALHGLVAARTFKFGVAVIVTPAALLAFAVGLAYVIRRRHQLER